jgi:outer membrane protein assembly factor BamB
VFSSPAVIGSHVYVGSTDGNLYALDRSSGVVSWTYFVGDRVWTSPAAFDDAVYFGSHDGFIYALEPSG